MAVQGKNKTIMKKFKTFLMLSIAVCAFASCSNNEVDPRDEFAGVYTFTQTGNWIASYDGTVVTNSPMNAEGTMICNKIGSTGNLIRLTGDLLADIDGMVSGNTLILNPLTITQNGSGVTMQFTFTFKPATKNGNIVTCVADIKGSAISNGITFPVSGSITIIAEKK